MGIIGAVMPRGAPDLFVLPMAKEKRRQTENQLASKVPGDKL